MHALLGLSSLLLVVLGGALALAGLGRPGRVGRLGGWAHRRDLQFLVLAGPVVSLGLGIAGLHHFAGRLCFLGAPPWDYAVGIALPLLMGLVALGALVLGLVRLALLRRLVARRGLPADAALQALASRLAARLGAPRPWVLLCAYNRPLAITCGLRRPTLLLSTWMVEQLDRRELESVLAHELGHAARRDYLVTWLATVLRDAFCYLPTSWAAYRQLQHERELACDDLAVGATRRPLALASALAKVWHEAASGAGLRTAAAQSLLGASEALESRIERLLAPPAPATVAAVAARRVRAHAVSLGTGAAAVAGLLALQAANVAVLLAPMGCGPASLLGRLV